MMFLIYLQWTNVIWKYFSLLKMSWRRIFVMESLSMRKSTGWSRFDVLILSGDSIYYIMLVKHPSYNFFSAIDLYLLNNFYAKIIKRNLILQKIPYFSLDKYHPTSVCKAFQFNFLSLFVFIAVHSLKSTVNEHWIW